MNRNQLLELPIFMQSPKTNQILREVASSIPARTKVYIIGGAVRNALYYHSFHKELPQRDYDIILIGDINGFVKNLQSKGFIYGKIRRTNEVTLKKKKVAKPKHEFNDYVFLDIHTSKERSIIKNLKNAAGFTINAFALSLKEVTSKNWVKKVIALRGALKDLKNKKLRVNAIAHPAMLFACIRFMSVGFKPPSKREVKELLAALGKLEKWRYGRNIRKVFEYVGGEKKARQLAKKLAIKEDIFDFETIRKIGIQF